jgi:hypothetical protein
MQYSKIILAFLLGSSPLFAELSIKNIEKMVRDIRAKRTSKITNTSPVVSPFIVIKNDENRSVMAEVSEKVVKVDFVLGAIVNSTAFIDGSWRRVGDEVGDFQLESIADGHVVLKRKNRTITLYFRKTKNIFKTDKE